MRLTQLWLTDFRNYDHRRAGASRRADGGRGRQRGGQDQPAGGGRVPGHLWSRSGGRRREALVRQGAERAVVRGEREPRGRELLDRGRDPGAGTGTGGRQPPAPATGGRPGGRAGGERVLPRRPGAGQGRPVGPAPLPRRPAGGPAPPQRRPAARPGAHPPPAHGPAPRLPAAGCRPPWRPPSTCGTPSWPPSATPWARPGPTWWPGWSRRWPRPTPASPGPTPDRWAVAYDAPWRVGGLAAALAASRAEELRRGVCLVGPHRDELVLAISGMPARTHASQGEQRSLALALRLAGHRVVGESAGEPPVLLLDDVFSELDESRSQALLDHLPPGQAILTTTGAIPPAATPDLVVEAPTPACQRVPSPPSSRERTRRLAARAPATRPHGRAPGVTWRPLKQAGHEVAPRRAGRLPAGRHPPHRRARRRRLRHPRVEVGRHRRAAPWPATAGPCAWAAAPSPSPSTRPGGSPS